MKHFKLTSAAFAGEVDLYFSDNELLHSFSIDNAALNDNQQRWLLKNLPNDLAEITKVIGKSPTAKIIEVTREITFEMFWNRYDDKITTSKKRTRARWDTLSTIDQVKAYDYIQRYFLNIPGGTRKKYPESYLNSFMWNN
jgi:hypothetical protein